MTEILKSLSVVNKALKAIGKNQKGFGYKFRGIDDVLNAIGPLFKDNDIVISREVVDIDRFTRSVIDKNGKNKDYVEATLQCKYHFTSLKDGSVFTSEGFGEGQDSSGGDKAMAMATSNAFKYVIFEMFTISVAEQKDSDQVTAEKEPKESFPKKEAAPKKETAPKEVKVTKNWTPSNSKTML